MYDCVLIAVDGSPVSDHVLEEAIELAGLSGGKLRIITVVDSPLRHLPDYTVYYNPELLREAALRTADDVLARARERVEASNVEGATFDRVYQERVSEEIIECVELEVQASDADVMVVGTHGHHDMHRLMLGSVAESLTRVALRPIPLVRDK